MQTLTKANNRCAVHGALCTVIILFSLQLVCASVTNIQTPEDKILAKGFSAYMDGADKQAFSYFEEVIRINPKNKAAQMGLEKVKVRMKKIEDEEKVKARRLAKSKCNEGRELLKTDDVVAAIDSFHGALDAVPDYSPAKSELAGIKKRMNRTLEKRQFNLSVWAFSRGVLAYLDRDWAKAWRIWSERSQIEPTNIPLAHATARAENNFKRMMISEQEDFFRRGARAFYEQGLYKEAKESWGKMLALRSDDQEGLEGMARAEEAILRAEGKGRIDEVHDILEKGLQYYAGQNWKKALTSFQQLAQVDPTFSTANEYIAKIKQHMQVNDYLPSTISQDVLFRKNKPSNQGNESVKVADKLENFADSKRELESQLKRDPTNISIQRELDRVAKAQEDESEKVYKEGLIAYSQGNRALAIQQWKQVLVINPEHKKAAAALKKARAEEERTDGSGTPQ